MPDRLPELELKSLLDPSDSPPQPQGFYNPEEEKYVPLPLSLRVEDVGGGDWFRSRPKKIKDLRDELGRFFEKPGTDPTTIVLWLSSLPTAPKRASMFADNLEGSGARVPSARRFAELALGLVEGMPPDMARRAIDDLLGELIELAGPSISSEATYIGYNDGLRGMVEFRNELATGSWLLTSPNAEDYRTLSGRSYPNWCAVVDRVYSSEKNYWSWYHRVFYRLEWRVPYMEYIREHGFLGLGAMEDGGGHIRRMGHANDFILATTSTPAHTAQALVLEETLSDLQDQGQVDYKVDVHPNGVHEFSLRPPEEEVVLCPTSLPSSQDKERDSTIRGRIVRRLRMIYSSFSPPDNFFTAELVKYCIPIFKSEAGGLWEKIEAFLADEGPVVVPEDRVSGGTVEIQDIGQDRGTTVNTMAELMAILTADRPSDFQKQLERVTLSSGLQLDAVFAALIPLIEKHSFASAREDHESNYWLLDTVVAFIDRMKVTGYRPGREVVELWDGYIEKIFPNAGKNYVDYYGQQYWKTYFRSGGEVKNRKFMGMTEGYKLQPDQTLLLEGMVMVEANHPAIEMVTRELSLSSVDISDLEHKLRTMFVGLRDIDVERLYRIDGAKVELLIPFFVETPEGLKQRILGYLSERSR